MKMKMWIGNYDGTRGGLVIAPTKKRAREIIAGGGAKVSAKAFDDYWALQVEVDESLEFEVLYTRDHRQYTKPTPPWVKGRCELTPRNKG